MPPPAQAPHDLLERLARDLGVDPAQGVIGAELDDDGLGSLRHRPVQPRQPAGRRVAGDARIADLDRHAFGPERLFEPGREGRVGGQPEPRGQGVPERHDPHRTIRRAGTAGERDGERQRRHNQGECLDQGRPTPI